MATTKVTPFPVPAQDSPQDSWVNRTIARLEAELGGHSIECDDEPVLEMTTEMFKLDEAISAWQSAKCYACGESFKRRIDAEIHRIQSVQCDDAVVSLWAPRPLN